MFDGFITGYLMMAAVTSITQLFNGKQSRKLQKELEYQKREWQREDYETRRSDQLEDYERKRQDEQRDYERKRNDDHEFFYIKHDYQFEKNIELQCYPFVRGARSFSSMLDESFPGVNRCDVPPIVLVQPIMDDSSYGYWNNARSQTQALLSEYDHQELLTVVPSAPERSFLWPYPEFYENDLLDRPTIIVQPTAAPDGINIWVGGCHLLPNRNAWPIHRMRHVMMLGRRKIKANINGKIQEISADRGLNDVEKRIAMQENAARAIEACVVYAMDCFHLTRKRAYRQRLFDLLTDDETLKLPTKKLARLSSKQVKDPAFYLLDNALQFAKTQEQERAVAMFWESMSSIAVESRFPHDVSEIEDIRPLLNHLRPKDRQQEHRWRSHIQLACDVMDKLPNAMDTRLPASEFKQESKEALRLGQI